MLKTSHISRILFLLILARSSFTNASDRDQWQQFRSDKAMQELDAEFEQAKPEAEVRAETRAVEKVVVKEVIKEVLVPVANHEPETKTDLLIADVDTSVTAEEDGYVFKISACKLSYRNIKCNLNNLNAEQDGNLTLFSDYGNDARTTKLFDRNGNEYHPGKIIMGNKSHKSYIKNKYVAGVTAKGEIHFNNVKDGNQAIALIELSITNDDTGKRSRIKFRNVNLTL